MNGTALVLAAHGSRHKPAVNKQIRDWAEQIAARTNFDEVAVTFHQGRPAFSEVLDTLTASEVTVVPVMTSSGYYSDTVLPRELALNDRYASLSIHQSAPLGMHPAIPLMIADRARQLMELENLSKNDCTIGLVGHGTPRHPASRNASLDLAKTLMGLGFDEVLPVFLDEQPKLEQLVELATRPAVIVVPFLIGAGPHATSDVPRRVGIKSRPFHVFPIAEGVSGRTVYCDMPLGSYPGMVDLIIDLASTRTGLSLEKEVA